MNEFEAHEGSYDHLHTKVCFLFSFYVSRFSPSFGNGGKGLVVLSFFLGEGCIRFRRMGSVSGPQMRIENVSVVEPAFKRDTEPNNHSFPRPLYQTIISICFGLYFIFRA